MTIKAMSPVITSVSLLMIPETFLSISFHEANEAESGCMGTGSSAYTDGFSMEKAGIVPCFPCLWPFF